MTFDPQQSKGHDPIFEYVDRSTLRALDTRPSFSNYLQQLWNSRHFTYAHARSTAFSASNDTFLGKLWLILDPILQVGVYALVFGVVLKTNRGIENFVGFLAIGVVFFRFLSSGLTNGSGLMQKNRAIVGSFSFPRASIPLGVTLRSFLDNLLPAAISVVFALLFQLDKGVTWAILFTPVLYVMVHIWSAGATLITCRCTAFVPDLRSLIRVITQGLFFVSGIFFSLERFDGSPMIQRIMEFNPLFQFLQSIRGVVLYGQIPSTFQFVYLMSWTLGIFVFGLIYFWKAEGRYAEAL